VFSLLGFGTGNIDWNVKIIANKFKFLKSIYSFLTDLGGLWILLISFYLRLPGCFSGV